MSDQEIGGRDVVAFVGSVCVASGKLRAIVGQVKEAMEEGSAEPVLLFDAVSSEPVEVDLRGSVEQVTARISSGAVPNRERAAGRPRLGVVAREVTLLPRHWEWLSEQPGGASVTLRKLVEEARRTTVGEVGLRRAREACYRFMNIMGGNEPGYEEALRALYAGDEQRFEVCIQQWPPDVRDHSRRLATPTFEQCRATGQPPQGGQ